MHEPNDGSMEQVVGRILFALHKDKLDKQRLMGLILCHLIYLGKFGKTKSLFGRASEEHENISPGS